MIHLMDKTTAILEKHLADLDALLEQARAMLAELNPPPAFVPRGEYVRLGSRAIEEQR